MFTTPTPKVTVITCCYNSAAYLRYTIDSVLQQTVQDFEYIFVDGGSTDGTLEIIAEYLKEMPEKMQLVHQTTKGLMRARNIGLTHAKGQYICFLDGDDIWHQEKLERQLAYMEAHPDLGLLFTNCVNINGQGEIIPGTGKKETPDLSIYGLYRHCYISNPTVMVSRKVYEELGYFDEGLYYSEDWDMWLRIACKYPLGYLHEVLAWYRVHGNNMSTGSLKHFDYQITVMRKIAGMESRLAPLLPKRLGSICLVKARKQMKMGDFKAARDSFKQGRQVYPQRTIIYLVGELLTYLPAPLLSIFIR